MGGRLPVLVVLVVWVVLVVPVVWVVPGFLLVRILSLTGHP